MKVFPGNEFGLTTPLLPRPALHTLYYHETEAGICMKAKTIVIYCNTLYYTYVNTVHYHAWYGPGSTRVLRVVL